MPGGLSLLHPSSSESLNPLCLMLKAHNPHKTIKWAADNKLATVLSVCHLLGQRYVGGLVTTLIACQALCCCCLGSRKELNSAVHTMNQTASANVAAGPE